MNVLIACECSGVVRRAFAAHGHKALSVDILPADDGATLSNNARLGSHLQGDILAFLDSANTDEFDLMIAHPPCTYLTNSAAWAYKDGPYHQKVKPGTLTGQARREARREAVEFAEKLKSAPIPRKAIENPPGHLSSAWGKADQYFQPHQFGDDASKLTGLWLFNLPPIKPANPIDPERFACRSCKTVWRAKDRSACPSCGGSLAAPVPVWGNQTPSGQNKLPPSKDRAKLRSNFFPGVAAAMAEQWGSLA